MPGRADRVRESAAAGPFRDFPEQGTVVVFDLEITAWEGSLARGWSEPDEFMEVVQIGAVKLDAAMPMAERASFEVLVTPEKNPLLSDYFIELTGITNADLSRHGVPFQDALTRFADFVGDAGLVVSNGSDWSDLVQNADWAGMAWPFKDDLFANIRPRLAGALGLQESQTVSSTLPQHLGHTAMPGAHTGLGDSRAIALAIRELRAQGRF
ncbi:exonuclease domain-containing protein [Nisaea nitritireducens]|uniref:exonuclease domain-containing protein n=1 Tax=Nisaea nitritireducens TaxID=568392 RepID=UPI00186764FA|nr:exonuclease domain-containing protein [Nisaea nitritireducens]